MCDMSESDDFYFMSLGDGLMLDAKPMGSNARFANHSCAPNCELQKWVTLGEHRLVLVSKRAMIAEEEVTYNYQYFDDDLGDIPRQKCKLGLALTQLGHNLTRILTQVCAALILALGLLVVEASRLLKNNGRKSLFLLSQEEKNIILSVSKNIWNSTK